MQFSAITVAELMMCSTQDVETILDAKKRASGFDTLPSSETNQEVSEADQVAIDYMKHCEKNGSSILDSSLNQRERVIKCTLENPSIERHDCAEIIYDSFSENERAQKGWSCKDVGIRCIKRTIDNLLHEKILRKEYPNRNKGCGWSPPQLFINK